MRVRAQREYQGNMYKNEWRRTTLYPTGGLGDVAMWHMKNIV